MALAQREQPFSFTLIIAGFVATLVGYASSAAIVFQAAEAAGAFSESAPHASGVIEHVV
ncbi:MAG: benzoate/H(+) symporter BenE family transporter, partial [Mixta calida]|nr:benzoate/H(+) symporter BenE family transporter [Mixta calida]